MTLPADSESFRIVIFDPAADTLSSADRVALDEDGDVSVFTFLRVDLETDHVILYARIVEGEIFSIAEKGTVGGIEVVMREEFPARQFAQTYSFGEVV